MEKVKVVIQNLNRQEIWVDEPEKSLLFHIGKAGIDWMQACGQKGRCTTCQFHVEKGEENLSPLTEQELKFRELRRLSMDNRLACQVKVSGPVVISVPNAVKLPHIVYSE